MAKNRASKALPFDLPALYQITIQGWLDPSWSDRLEGMAITISSSAEDSPATTLQGELSDQAALAGVLNTLYELHFTVFEVKRLDG